MKTNNDKISFGCGEVIDDIFGTIVEDEGSFLRLLLDDDNSCNPEYEMKLVEEQETGFGSAPKRLKRFADTNKGVMRIFTRYMLRTNPRLFPDSLKVQQRIQDMFNVARRKDPPPELVEEYLPGIGQFITENKLNMTAMMNYLYSSLTKKGARGRSKMAPEAPAAASEIRFGNALLGARVLEGRGQRGEASNLKPIPMEIISKIVDAGSLDTILRDYNKNLIITAFRRAQNSQEDKLLLFKYLSYLSCSIIMWFENNYPDIFSLGDGVWESVISSLILESLPPLDADDVVRALNNMIQVLSGALRADDLLEITQRPIEIARWAATSGLYDESFRILLPSVTVDRVAAGGNQTEADINRLVPRILRLEDERKGLLQNDNVTRFLPVFAEGGGGMMGGPQGMMGGPGGMMGGPQGMMVEVKRGFVSPSKDAAALPEPGTRVEYVDERDNSVRSGILTNRLDGNRVYVVTKEGQAGGAGEWVSLEQLVLNQGGGSRRRKTRKKKKRKRKKTRKKKKEAQKKN